MKALLLLGKRSTNNSSWERVSGFGLQVVQQSLTWEFPKIRGTFLGLPIMRTIIYLGLYWGPPILGKFHFALFKKCGVGGVRGRRSQCLYSSRIDPQ